MRLLWFLMAISVIGLRAEIPRLEKQGSGTRLIVEGKPFVMIAGEAHNSSASDLAYFDRVCGKFAQLNANTIIVPIAWEQFEPREGEFDAALIDGMIKTARRHDLKLVVLWFGSWKNGVSSYVPEWVKKDLKRFPKARGTSNRNVKDVLSTLSEACREADRKAFVELMRRIKDADGAGRTVIMVQVENEMGIRPEIRDRSEEADAAFARTVPSELMTYLVKNREALHPELLKRWGKNGFKTAGTWDEVFGGGHEAEEVFSVWCYATYTGGIAAAGKSVWPLPMYVNAWLPDPKGEWGNYPSGGPVAHMMDVWRAAAPAIDVFAPDIYLSNYKEICVQYNAGGNPLLIPEHSRDDDTPAKAYWAFGRHHALCFSPFGFESFATNHPLVCTYAILKQLMPLIGAAQGTPRMSAVYNEKDGEPEQLLPMEGWTLRAKAFGKSPNGRGGAIVIQTGKDEFIIAGHNFEVQTQGDEKILSVEIGRIEKEIFIPELRLNGDETGANGVLRHPAFKSNFFLEPDLPRIFRLRLYRLK